MFKKLNFSKLKFKIRSLLPKTYHLECNFLKSKTYIFFIFAICIIVAIFLIFFFINQKSTKPSLDTIDKSIVKEIVPLAQGKQVYSIRTDTPNNPQIIKVELDPLDVQIGEKQILTVTVKHSDEESITDENIATAIYYTDNGSSTTKLKLRRADGPPLVTIWDGVWIPEDTHDYTYQAAITAISAAGEFLTTLSFR